MAYNEQNEDELMAELRELIRLGQGVNQQNTTTPFGSVKYTDMAAPALTEAEWLEQNPGGLPEDTRIAPTNPLGEGDWRRQFGPGSSNYTGGNYQDYRTGGPAPTGPTYEGYLSDFENNYVPDMQMDVAFSDKMQSLFDKQFAPDAYDSYKDDYMDEFRYRSDPIFDQQDDRFAQSMFDRGMPLGSEYHDDAYLLKEQGQNDALTSAIRTSQGLADNAKLLDYNKIMGAFNGTQVQPTQVDVMGPYNTLQNLNMFDEQSRNQRRSDKFNLLGDLGTALAWGLD